MRFEEELDEDLDWRRSGPNLFDTVIGLTQRGGEGIMGGRGGFFLLKASSGIGLPAGSFWVDDKSGLFGRGEEKAAEIGGVEEQGTHSLRGVSGGSSCTFKKSSLGEVSRFWEK